jgi:hypothetical protein
MSNYVKPIIGDREQVIKEYKKVTSILDQLEILMLGTFNPEVDTENVDCSMSAAIKYNIYNKSILSLNIIKEKMSSFLLADSAEVTYWGNKNEDFYEYLSAMKFAKDILEGRIEYD